MSKVSTPSRVLQKEVDLPRINQKSKVFSYLSVRIRRQRTLPLSKDPKTEIFPGYNIGKHHTISIKYNH